MGMTQNDIGLVPRVKVPDVGLITLAPLEELRRLQREEKTRLDALWRQAAAIDEQARDRLADAGSRLVIGWNQWEPSAQLRPTLDEAQQLLKQIWDLDQQLRELQTPHSAGIIA